MENSTTLKFAAINKSVETLIPKPKESENRGKGHIYWGENDDYPNFLFQLFQECPVLATILSTSTDYVVGDGIIPNVPGFTYANKKDEPWEDLISKVAFDYLTFGIAYIQIIRNNAGRVSEFYHLDARYMRSDEDNELFYYNKEFGKKYGRSNKTLIYPKFIANAVDEPASVICIKNPFSRGVYGTPIWQGAIKAVMTETKISTFNLSELENNFSVSAIINFNNGQPDDEQVSEIEDMVQEKFCGAENASRFMLSFNNGKDNATTVERLGADDFDKRYVELGKKVQNDIFTAFGMNANLLGVHTEQNGFNAEEYDQSFKLYNRTRIMPIQKRIIDAIDKALGIKSSLTIKPFTLSGETEDNIN